MRRGGYTIPRKMRDFWKPRRAKTRKNRSRNLAGHRARRLAAFWAMGPILTIADVEPYHARRMFRECFLGQTTANSWPLIQPEKAAKCTENKHNHKKLPNRVHMARFGPILARNPSHGLWEASGMPPGLQNRSKNQKITLGGVGARGICPSISPSWP